MTFAIIVLWRPGDPWRERLWGFTRPRWETLGLPIVEADDPRGLYAARNSGAHAAGDWDAAIFADADIALDEPERALEALDLAARESVYVAAYTRLVALGVPGTERTLDIGEFAPTPAARSHYGSWVGAFAIGRALFDELGGYDERFAPYAGQDVAIVHAALTLARLERVAGTAWHLWHPSGGIGHPERGHPVLWRRYQEATGDRAAMRELLAR